ncbi:helix-turn-helix domain-containing protein [Promicromonospora iranensis]|uniref:DNA-binding HxlR family transcriptional regulator n=1 Tax=Promicromonospora iranensis TaxID=1105144 RepID=A0ABU2CT28_9MICO|nr:helix-turn-helix domain-containing protein [Promicromonospora iranensis]MDR7384490.1 DNA-binding HxlR family transcriptional regulator [Promicromonospora iranensis]
MTTAPEMRLPVQRAIEVCPVEVSMAVLGGAWKLSTVKYLLEHTHRFGELQRRLGLVTARTLTRVLRDLEADGIVVRTVYAEVPPRVEYSLTELGRSLDQVVGWLDTWGATYPRPTPGADAEPPTE